MPEKKPTRTADLDYFYGQSSELFSFYRIPKLLFQDSRFQPLSTDAKTLYGILLDRMSLSARNGWLDKAGRVFIIYTVQEVQDSLGCADKKATKLLRELEEYSLIERKRRGLGKPDLIYVKNFSSESSKTPYLNRDNDDSGTVQNTLQDPAKLRCNKTERNNTEVSDTDPIYSDENDWMSKRAQLEEYFSQSLEVDLLLRLCPDDEDTIYQIVDLLVDTCATNRKLLRELEEYGLIERKRRGLGKPDLIYVKNFSPESSKTPYMNRDNDDSGAVQNTLQDPAKLRCNKTERNNTEISDTDPISSDENDWMSKRAQLEEYFSQSLEVELLLRLYPDDEDTLYQIVNLLVDTCATNRKTLRIAGDDKPAEVVRSRFMKLNADHIRFVLKCLAENSSPIRNMKQYLLASLYNAPTTMQLSYQNQTNHDLAMRG